ncbi:MAG TPA: hypothetical protein PK398_01210 [Candidatus Gracilibacteria bacterium]|nr:hypothetical protein [Candidatus Gracilibacteria bacterium]
MNYPSLLTPNDTEFLRVDEQQIILPKCQINFNKWKGVTIAHTFGGKPLIDVEGIPMFAEMAILKLFEKSGWETRWIETYARPKSSPIYLNEWKDDEFKNQIHVPIENEKINELLSTIANNNENLFHGAWDVLGWSGENILFTESKRLKKDQIRNSQIDWLRAGLKVGLKPENFMIVQWDFVLS